ncbi:hypothetical protein K4K61_000610 [Colletotrichum sp. SAR11_59]|nr:hypothetical protein K4K61_000610 [Colletotrichum sp. SAR11_59]
MISKKSVRVGGRERHLRLRESLRILRHLTQQDLTPASQAAGEEPDNLRLGNDLLVDFRDRVKAARFAA